MGKLKKAVRKAVVALLQDFTDGFRRSWDCGE